LEPLRGQNRNIGILSVKAAAVKIIPKCGPPTKPAKSGLETPLPKLP